MEFVYNIGGGAPHVKKYLVKGGVTVGVGVPVASDASTADGDGVIAATSVAAVMILGLSVDTAATTAAQVASGDNGGYVSTIINPDACFRAKLSGSSASDTTLSVVSTAQAASATGLTVTAATDEFTVWGYSGANAGFVRRCTDAATVVTAFPYDIAAGDRFVETSVVIADQTQWPELTGTFDQIDATLAVDADNDNFVTVELLLRDESDDGLVNSYAIIHPAQHAFNTVGTVPSG
jgi:hypothetical protein